MPRLKRSAADQDLIDTAGPDFLEALARGLRVLETGARSTPWSISVTLRPMIVCSG
jgi:hypothetical protein